MQLTRNVDGTNTYVLRAADDTPPVAEEITAVSWNKMARGVLR